MDFKVGVFAKGQISGEVVSETKKVLQELALKYKCRFELSKGVDESGKSKKDTGKFNEKINKKVKGEKGVHLSFGGELEF